MNSGPAPAGARSCRLGQRGIDYIVYPIDDERPPLGVFPELKTGAAGERFRLVLPSFPTDWHGRVYLYRLTRRP